MVVIWKKNTTCRYNKLYDKSTTNPRLIEVMESDTNQVDLCHNCPASDCDWVWLRTVIVDSTVELQLLKRDFAPNVRTIEPTDCGRSRNIGSAQTMHASDGFTQRQYRLTDWLAGD